MSNVNRGDMWESEKRRFDEWVNSLPNLSGAERNALENNFNASGLQGSQNVYQKHFSPEAKAPAETYVNPNLERETPPATTTYDQSLRADRDETAQYRADLDQSISQYARSEQTCGPRCN